MSKRNTTENTAVSTIIMSRGFSTDHSTPSMLRRYLSLKSFETREVRMNQSRLNRVLAALIMRIVASLMRRAPLRGVFCNLRKTA